MLFVSYSASIPSPLPRPTLSSASLTNVGDPQDLLLGISSEDEPNKEAEDPQAKPIGFQPILHEEVEGHPNEPNEKVEELGLWRIGQKIRRSVAGASPRVADAIARIKTMNEGETEAGGNVPAFSFV